MVHDFENDLLAETDALDALDALIKEYGLNEVTKLKEEDDEMAAIWKAGAEATRAVKRRWRDNIKAQALEQAAHKKKLGIPDSHSEKIIAEVSEDEHESDEDLIKSAREELATDDGAWHFKYSESDLEDELLRKSEEEAQLDVKKDHYTVVASEVVENISYIDGDERDEDGKFKKNKEVALVRSEARNFNQWSTPIDSMSDEDKERIQRNAVMNIHSTESHLGSRDIRAKLVDGGFQIAKEYSAEESAKRFKFTRVNTVVSDVPMCQFYINHELIYTMDVDAAATVDATVMNLTSSNHDTEKMSELDKLTQVERLCHEIKQKTDLVIDPNDIYGYLDSGYLINGDLEKDEIDVEIG